jgi:hypothetical protein
MNYNSPDSIAPKDEFKDSPSHTLYELQLAPPIVPLKEPTTEFFIIRQQVDVDALEVENSHDPSVFLTGLEPKTIVEEPDGATKDRAQPKLRKS